MTKRHLPLSISILTCGLFLVSPAHAQFNEQQMSAMVAAAEGLGKGQAIGDACGTDTANMATLIARGWKCQGASTEQLARLQAVAADSRKKNKVAACPTDKAAHAQQVKKSTGELEAGLAKVNCKG